MISSIACLQLVPRRSCLTAVKDFRPLGARLRRTPFWRPTMLHSPRNRALRSRLDRRRSRRERSVSSSVQKLGRQNKVEGRQAPAQPEESVERMLHSLARRSTAYVNNNSHSQTPMPSTPNGPVYFSNR